MQISELDQYLQNKCQIFWILIPFSLKTMFSNTPYVLTDISKAFRR